MVGWKCFLLIQLPTGSFFKLSTFSYDISHRRSSLRKTSKISNCRENHKLMAKWNVVVEPLLKNICGPWFYEINFKNIPLRDLTTNYCLKGSAFPKCLGSLYDRSYIISYLTLALWSLVLRDKLREHSHKLPVWKWNHLKNCDQSMPRCDDNLLNSCRMLADDLLIQMLVGSYFRTWTQPQ